MRRLAIVCIVATTTLLAPACVSPRHSAIDRLPQFFVWAWERPEDLRDLDRGIGVAFLAQTITITSDHFRAVPRRQPLRVNPQAMLVAVTRIEVTPTMAAALPSPAIDALVAALNATATLPRVAGVQIDFDAVASERPLYRQLLETLRRRLPPAMPISITALASWCAGDDWLAGLPIDEAVPMLFRMGPTNEPFLGMASDRASASPRCRGAVGMSVDEPIKARADNRRIYVFNPRSWTRMTLLQARNRVTP